MKNRMDSFRKLLKGGSRISVATGAIPPEAILSNYLDVEEQQPETKIRPRTLRRLIVYISAEKRLLWGGTLLIIAGTAATLGEPRLFGYAIDQAIVPRDLGILKKLGIVFLLIECIRFISVVGQGYLFAFLGQKVMQRLRVELFSHLQRLPVAVYDRNPVGRLVTRVTNDVAALAEMFSAGFVTIIGNILTVVGILAWLMILDLRLGLIASSVFPFLVLVSIYFSARLKVAYRDARGKLSALNAFLAENILGIRIVHLFNRQRLHRQRFRQINQWYTDAQISSVRLYAFFQPAITWFSGIAAALVIWYGGRATADGSLQVGVLVSYFTYVLLVFQPVREIADRWNIILSGMASAERIFSVLDWEPELDETATSQPPAPMARLRGHIQFENVWFAYDGAAGTERWVLRDFSFEIQPGQRIGVVGHTGAGKTTLISLLLRFYEPQRGRILLDGKDLREYDKRSLRAAIGIVQQDVFLFSGTLRENITVWREPRPEAWQEVTASLTAMGYDRWLVEGEGALKLQERGSNLSSGERQVLAFARALASDPSIWILDEATANVDSESEERLNRRLDGASQGATSILIAHRLATVRSADQILVLHRGALVELGRHEQLMAHNGIYARLYRYQTAVAQAELPV